jgi:hypothetical protein
MRLRALDIADQVAPEAFFPPGSPRRMVDAIGVVVRLAQMRTLDSAFHVRMELWQHTQGRLTRRRALRLLQSGRRSSSRQGRRQRGARRRTLFTAGGHRSSG